jgi:hypothetical protein
MKKLGSLFLLAVFLSACGGPTVKNAGTIIEREFKEGKVVSENEQRSPYSEYLNKVSEQKPIFDMACPQDGCKILSLKVYAPNGANGASAISPPPVEPNANVAFVQGMFDLGKTFLATGVAVAPWVGVTRIVSKLIGPLSIPSSVDNSYHFSDSSNRSLTTSVNTTNTTTVTASGAGSGAASGGAGTGSNAPQTTTTTTTNPPPTIP